MQGYKTADQFFAAATEWQAELLELRSILQSTELEETVKWGSPVFTADGSNIVGIGGFKSYFGLWFFQGALLADPKNVLINAQEGKTKALRQMRFGSKEEIDRDLILAYAREAIDLAKRGVAIKPDRNQPLTVPPELRAALRENLKASVSFKAMTPGRQREYAEYVDSAKREATKQTRIAKILPMIESGIGLHDKYRRC